MRKLSIILLGLFLLLSQTKPTQAQIYSVLTPELFKPSQKKRHLKQDDLVRMQGYISGFLRIKEVNRDTSVEIVKGKVYINTVSNISERTCDASTKVALEPGTGKEVFLPKSGKLKPTTIFTQWENNLPQIEVRIEESANTLTFAAQDSLGAYYLVSNVTLDDDLPKELLNDPTRFFVKYGGKIYEVIEGKQVFIRYVEKKSAKTKVKTKKAKGVKVK